MTKLTVTIGNIIFARLFATDPQFLNEFSQPILEDSVDILDGLLTRTSMAMWERMILTMFPIKNMDQRSISLKYEAGGTMQWP